MARRSRDISTFENIRGVMKRAPSALSRLAGKVVNIRIRSIEDIQNLEIPNCLKKELSECYIEDCLYCKEKITFAEEFVREASEARFDEPFSNVGADGYLLYRNWKRRYGVPKFSWEVNHVVHCFYTFGCRFENGNYFEEDVRYCVECAHRSSFVRSVSTHMKKSVYSERVPACDLIDEVFDVSNNWCDGCATRALFYIEGYDEEETWFINKRSWLSLNDE